MPRTLPRGCWTGSWTNWSVTWTRRRFRMRCSPRLRRLGWRHQFARCRSEEVSLAMLSVDRWLGPALGMLPQTTIWQDGDGAQSGSVYHLCDELLFDAYPYQIIGPGHLRRLGGSPPGSAGLPGGRMEYAAGDLRDWLPSSPRRDAALAAARRARA